MMKAMRFSMPRDDQLELRFDVDGTGVAQLGKKAGKKDDTFLLCVSIPECECVSRPFIASLHTFPSLTETVVRFADEL
jgi:hypothetical protein